MSAQRENELRNMHDDAAWTLPPQQEYRVSGLHRRATCNC